MYWRYGIAVEQIGLRGPEATNYASVVRMHLSWIEQVDVGNLLFRAIAREVLEAPASRLAKFNSPAQPGYPTRGILVRPYTGGACNAQASRASVFYSPYIFFGSCWDLLLRVSMNRGLYPQEMLFHELIHALRDVAGFGHDVMPLSGGLEGYSNQEELIAVVVSNIFMTDPTNKKADRLGLRAGHGLGKLESHLANSLDWFLSSADAFERIERFCHDNTWFTEKLANTKATFNPIAAYYHDRDKARSNSRSLLAVPHSGQPRK